MASNDSDAAPVLIGITTYLEQAQTGVWDVRASFLPNVYITAVTESGGTVTALPPQPITPRQADAIVAGVDGIVFSGGADVDPALYGQEPHERTGAPRKDRDEFELALMRAAIDSDTPFLAICRGFQLLNVLLGGTLIQHLPDRVGHENYQLGGGKFTTQKLTVARDSLIGEALPDGRVTAHLYHHQGIDRLADALTLTSSTDEGVIQAAELPDHTFALAVQWHPEENTSDRRLFEALVAASRAQSESTRKASNA